MPLIASIAYFVVMIFIVTLFIRLVFDWIQVFSRDWRPKGLMLLIAEAVYTVTDPPLKLLRKVIPPLRIGNVALDLAFLVLIFGCSILLNVIIRVAS
ncbi:MAG TPA: YggT family protein [Beutenbergiaceae bacterium]|nr:YggT family protein [Beutenbergiaceae bacterium]